MGGGLPGDIGGARDVFVGRIRAASDERHRDAIGIAAVRDVGGGALVVSQFTLYGNAKKGNRPSFIEAAPPKNALYRSDDGGMSFRQVSSQVSLTYRPWYYTHLTADPLDREMLYVNNETFWVSTDGGRSFEARPTPHGDNHDVWINPNNPDIMIQSNDGGATVSLDGGRTWSTENNQPTAELYQLYVDNQYPLRVYGAQIGRAHV